MNSSKPVSQANSSSRASLKVAAQQSEERRSVIGGRLLLKTLGILLLLAVAVAVLMPAQVMAKSKQQSAAAKKKAKSGKAMKAFARHSAAANKSGMKRVVIRGKNGRKMVVYRAAFAKVAAPAPRPSMGQLAGLHGVQDPLELKSSVAFVMDQDTSEILVSKNANAVLPIASITKLMTAIVVLDGAQDLNSLIEITEEDIDTEKGSRSRLTVGTQLTRKEMLHLALMSSENRAAHALGRASRNGRADFVAQMNAKARALGMYETAFADPTGLSSANRSSAQDLAKLVRAAYKYPVIRHYSTDVAIDVTNSTGRQLRYVNTNRLVQNPDWQIGLQKTGFISEAGQCLVMQTSIQGRSLIMVFLDSMGKLSRVGDAGRVRNWLEGAAAMGQPVVPMSVQRTL
jgi:serine-type D-Ala-D-Ala endopeptidase (penicillin-binding protein 7)